jgi:hypothetical protein
LRVGVLLSGAYDDGRPHAVNRVDVPGTLYQDLGGIQPSGGDSRR